MAFSWLRAGARGDHSISRRNYNNVSSPVRRLRRSPPHRRLREHDEGECISVRTRATMVDTVAGCTVLSPPSGKVRGVVSFLGGAFVGAAPQLAYPFLLRKITEAGYTVVCVPYKVTFKHLACASAVADRFNAAIKGLDDEGLAYLAPPDVPIIGVGHSNGSLLHMLCGSMYGGDDRRVANIVMSFNNKQVSDAVPIPGFLDNIGPVANALEGLGVRSPDLKATLDQLRGIAGPSGPWASLDESILRDLQPALDQIPDAVNEIRLDGVTEFTPTPAESLQLISGGYKVPRTLLVRFADDPIDESRALQRALLDGGRNPADNALLELAGSHVTPCAPDSAPRPADPSGRVSPADFLAAGASFVLSRETSLLADRVVAFLDDETR